jgi:hypothetical protein
MWHPYGGFKSSGCLLHLLLDLDDRAKIPAFFKKSWYDKTIKELNLSKMSAENRLIYELTWARIAATATQDEIDVKNRDAERDAERTRETIINLLEVGVDIDKIAKATKQSIDYVLDIKNQMQAEK